MNPPCLSPEDQQALAAGSPLVGDDWEQRLRQIPVDLEMTAKDTHALQRKREVKSAADLLRLVLAYSVCDWSLRLVGLWATVIGLGHLSDTAVLKRLRHSQAWLSRLLSEWLSLRRGVLRGQTGRLRLIDATTVSQPGSVGTDWRLHVSFDLGRFGIDGVEITDASGGETLARHAAQAGEILVQDRGYAHRIGLGTVLATGAQVVSRLNWHNLPLETPDGQKFDLLAWLEQAVPLTDPGQTEVWVSTPSGRFEMRLIAQRLPPDAVEAARRRVRDNARKKGHIPSAGSLLAAGFVLDLTNLMNLHHWPAEQILAVYRLRWQIELLFKRWKGLWDLAHLRSQDPALSQVYLLGKLLGVLLVEGWPGAAALDHAGWWENVTRPVSAWRWTGLGAELLRQAIRGPLTFARCLAVLPQLARYLCDTPRQRPQQLAHARHWLRQLGIMIEDLAQDSIHALPLLHDSMP